MQVVPKRGLFCSCGVSPSPCTVTVRSDAVVAQAFLTLRGIVSSGCDFASQ
jgi:hypothetical protein